MSKINNTGVIGIAIGIAGLLYGAYQAKQTKQVAETLETTVANVVAGKVEVPESMIAAAAEKAVEARANTQIDACVTGVRRKIEADIQSRINDALVPNMDAINSVVDDAIKRIDAREVAKSATEKAIAKTAEDTFTRAKKYSEEINKLYTSAAYNSFVQHVDPLRNAAGSSRYPWL